jgi:hypothetical protein
MADDIKKTSTLEAAAAAVKAGLNGEYSPEHMRRGSSGRYDHESSQDVAPVDSFSDNGLISRLKNKSKRAIEDQGG